MSGGVICDGIGSAIAAVFGVLPNTSFSQNVGLVAMTKIVNRFALATGAVFLILCGLIPKLGALWFPLCRNPFWAAVAVMMFSSIVVSGIQLVTKESSIRDPDDYFCCFRRWLRHGRYTRHPGTLPEAMRMMFGESGIVPATFVAILLNIILNRGEDAQEAVFILLCIYIQQLVDILDRYFYYQFRIFFCQYGTTLVLWRLRVCWQILQGR